MPSQTFKSVKIYKNCIEGNRRQVYKGKKCKNDACKYTQRPGQHKDKLQNWH